MDQLLNFADCFILCPLSCSLSYAIFKDLYQIAVNRRRIYARHFSDDLLINPGFVFGGIFGLIGYIYGIPVIPNLLKIKKNWILVYLFRI